jgi:hypothetical protein
MASPRGCPEGKSGLILLARQSASALYLRWNLHAGWGIQLGDTVSPSVSPCAGHPMAGYPTPLADHVCNWRKQTNDRWTRQPPSPDSRPEKMMQRSNMSWTRGTSVIERRRRDLTAP